MLKYLRCVKRTGFVLILMAWSIASSFAAGTTPDDDLLSRKVTINVKNKNLKFALDYLVSKYSLPIIYSNSAILENSIVNIHAKNKPLTNVLNELLVGQSISYRIIEHKIVIIKKISSEKPPNGSPIRGQVSNDAGEALTGATVRTNSGQTVLTDKDGKFLLQDVQLNTIIQISFIGYQTKEVWIESYAKDIVIKLEPEDAKLKEVTIVSNGYQRLPKERATGSFVLLDSAIINRRVSTDVLSRLEGMVPGLLFNRNTINSTNGTLDLNIRGHSTLFANDQPLVILDNFPYDGNINNINPNDIESITILKDAAAASIWGVRSGNGVIVLTTKKGMPNQPLLVDINANLTFGARPNVFYSPDFLNANDFINYEQTLFNKGYYNNSINNSSYPPLSPVVQILTNQRAGVITDRKSVV